jgi:serine/threonine-protein kinase RsbW
MHQYGNEHREPGIKIDLSTHKSVQSETLHTLAELRSLSDKVDDWMRVLGYTGKDIFAVRLALGEAVLNAFRHGNLGDPAKVVRVRWVVTPAEAAFEVQDEGSGFDPELVPDPAAGDNHKRISGRGLYLMRVYMSGVTYNQIGNCVTLWRRRSNA